MYTCTTIRHNICLKTVLYFCNRTVLKVLCNQTSSPWTMGSSSSLKRLLTIVRGHFGRKSRYLLRNCNAYRIKVKRVYTVKMYMIQWIWKWTTSQLEWSYMKCTFFVYFAAIAMFRNGGGVTVCHQVPRVFTKTKEQEEKSVFELSLVSSQIRLSSQSYAQWVSEWHSAQERLC